MEVPINVLAGSDTTSGNRGCIMPSTIHMKIRGYHIDAFGHVNHARYIRFMEEARWDYFDRHKEMSGTLTEKGVAHATVHISINYHHPAVLGDVIRIETGIGKKSRRSITFEQKIYMGNPDRLVVDAEVVNVFFDGKSGHIVETCSETFSSWEDLQGLEENGSASG